MKWIRVELYILWEELSFLTCITLSFHYYSQHFYITIMQIIYHFNIYFDYTVRFSINWNGSMKYLICNNKYKLVLKRYTKSSLLNQKFSIYIQKLNQQQTLLSNSNKVGLFNEYYHKCSSPKSRCQGVKFSSSIQSTPHVSWPHSPF